MVFTFAIFRVGLIFVKKGYSFGQWETTCDPAPPLSELIIASVVLLKYPNQQTVTCKNSAEIMIYLHDIARGTAESSGMYILHSFVDLLLLGAAEIGDTESSSFHF